MLLITFKWIFILLIIIGVFGGAAAFGYFTSLVKDDIIRDEQMIYEEINKNTLTGFVYFNDEETQVGQLRGIDRRLIEDLRDVPTVIQNAVVAIEDDEFFTHWGIDVFGFLRAVKQQLLNEPVQTGGSTITQQVARNVFLSLDRSVERKAKELLLAMRLERYLSKPEILLAYLNKVPFGNGSSGYNVYGIKAAAKGIFDIDDLSEIHLAQAAYLAGLPQDPTDYSAFDGYGQFDEEGFNNAVERQRRVLERMLTVGFITEAEYEEALQFDLRASLAESKQKAYATYPFLMIEAERKAAEALLMQENPELTAEDLRTEEYTQLVNQMREDMLGKGYQIYTTIDQRIYQAMQEIAANPENFVPDHEEKGIEQVGAILIENKTGAILGMIEGRDFYEEQLNHATQMVRQPGSAMKPVAAYLPALESGDVQPASILDDSPIILTDGSKGYHLPRNYNYRYHGLVTARYALNHSLNIPALRLFNEVVGIENAWAFAKDLGITTITESDYHAQTGVIGGLAYGTSVEELANAYASIPNQGTFLDAYMIKRIEDSNGNIVYEHKAEPKQVYSEETAFLMTDMLKTVITQGSGTSILSTFEHYNEFEVAGKTGTTQNSTDIWFVGFSPDVTVGVWTGYDQPSTVLSDRTARNIWSLVMDKSIEASPEFFANKSFETPENVVRRTVSGISGLISNSLVSQYGSVNTDWFNRKYIPTTEDSHVVRTSYVRYKGMNYIPSEDTPKDMIKDGYLFVRDLNIYEILNQIEDILNKMPYSLRPKRYGVAMKLEDFYPEDLDKTAPQLPLPDDEDNGPPAPPTNLSLKKEGSSYVITFKNSGSEDTIGYRFYRSVNGEPFKWFEGKVVFHGDYPAFYVSQNDDIEYAYYLTAVDAHGNESKPSEVLYANVDGEPVMPPLPGEEPVQDSDDDIDNGGDSDNEEVHAPTPPINVQISGDSDAVTISWEANPDYENITKYEIYYSNDPIIPFQQIGWSQSTQFKNITPPLEGWYRVVAVNENGDKSAPSLMTKFILQTDTEPPASGSDEDEQDEDDQQEQDNQNDQNDEEDQDNQDNQEDEQDH